MQLHKLKSRGLKKKKRVGRGISAGGGKTCGRGTKGQKSRSGSKAKPGFEGGQMPLIKRLPKRRGFYNMFSLHWQIVNVDKLNKFKNETKIDLKLLYNEGIVRNCKDKLKILSNGSLDKKLEIHAHSFSKQAKKKIEKVGGKAVVIKVSNVALKRMEQAPVTKVTKEKHEVSKKEEVGNIKTSHSAPKTSKNKPKSRKITKNKFKK